MSNNILDTILDYHEKCLQMYSNIKEKIDKLPSYDRKIMTDMYLYGSGDFDNNKIMYIFSMIIEMLKLESIDILLEYYEDTDHISMLQLCPNEIQKFTTQCMKRKKVNLVFTSCATHKTLCANGTLLYNLIKDRYNFNKQFEESLIKIQHDKPITKQESGSFLKFYHEIKEYNDKILILCDKLDNMIKSYPVDVAKLLHNKFPKTDYYFKVQLFLHVIDEYELGKQMVCYDDHDHVSICTHSSEYIKLVKGIGLDKIEDIFTKCTHHKTRCICGKELFELCKEMYEQYLQFETLCNQSVISLNVGNSLSSTYSSYSSDDVSSSDDITFECFTQIDTFTR